MVRQTRVIVNASILMLLFGSTLWLVRDSLAEQLGTLAVAATFGILHGAVYCWRLSGRIVCKTARFEPNEVPVKFLSIFEVGLVTAASGHYLMIVFGVLLLASIIAHGLLGHGLTVLIGSFAVAAVRQCLWGTPFGMNIVMVACTTSTTTGPGWVLKGCSTPRRRSSTPSCPLAGY